MFCEKIISHGINDGPVSSFSSQFFKVEPSSNELSKKIISQFPFHFAVVVHHSEQFYRFIFSKINETCDHSVLKNYMEITYYSLCF